MDEARFGEHGLLFSMDFDKNTKTNSLCLRLRQDLKQSSDAEQPLLEDLITCAAPPCATRKYLFRFSSDPNFSH